MTLTRLGLVAAVLEIAMPAVAFAATSTPDQIRTEIAALDTRYQAAVKANDATTMAEILHDDMVLVVGAGTVVTRAELLQAARDGTLVYEVQDEDPGTQIVRLFGPDTAVVTARLRLKYQTAGKASDRRLWFSDTYVRTPGGWKYAFGQSSIALPPEG